MKKMHSLLRAMVAFALCCSMLPGAAIAAGTAKGESGIMPLASLYTDRAYSEKSGAWQSVKFTATSGSGDYIRYWFGNETNEKCVVSLYQTNRTPEPKRVSYMYVGGDENKSMVYYDRTAGGGTYYILIEAIQSGGLIDGDVSVAQYATNPG